MDKREMLIEKIVLLLLSSSNHDYDDMTNEACDMATRASNQSWVIPGSPHYNKRMARIKRKSKRR